MAETTSESNSLLYSWLTMVHEREAQLWTLFPESESWGGTRWDKQRSTGALYSVQRYTIVHNGVQEVADEW